MPDELPPIELPFRKDDPSDYLDLGTCRICEKTDSDVWHNDSICYECGDTPAAYILHTLDQIEVMARGYQPIPGSDLVAIDRNDVRKILLSLQAATRALIKERYDAPPV